MPTQKQHILNILIAAVIVAAIIVLIVAVSLRANQRGGGGEVSQMNSNSLEEAASGVSGSIRLTANERADKYEDAVKELEIASKDKNVTADVFADLAVAYYNTSQLDKSVENWEKAIIGDPVNAKYYNNLANVLRDKGDYTGAEDNYAKALEVDKKFVTAYLNLAVMRRYKTSNIDGAIAILQSGLANNPGDERLLNVLSVYKK